MALRVWLPLNGTLENKGISDVTVTNNGATVDNSGKIGKTYLFNGNYIKTEYSDYPAIFSNDFSICLWVYSTTNKARDIYFANYGLSGGGNWFNLERDANNYLRFWWNDGSPDYHNSNFSINQNEWTHITVTRSGNILTEYKNGILVNTYSTTLSNAIPSTATVFYLGADYRTGQSIDLYGKLNDVRIYDHCLSAKEVKEISQGLVLHYKLDGWSGGTGENLMLGTLMTQIPIGTSTDYTNLTHIRYYNTSASNCTISNNEATILLNGTGNLGIAFERLASEINFDTSSYYTLSCEAKTTMSGAQLSIGTSYYKTDDTPVWRGGSNKKAFNSLNSWQTFTLTFKPDTDIKAICYCFTVNGTSGGTETAIIRHCKLEKGSIATVWSPASEDLGINTTKITDSSGYEYDGNIVNATTENINLDGRYQVCTNFLGTTVDTTSNTITGAQYLYASFPMPAWNALTLAWWGNNITYGRGGIFETTGTTGNIWEGNDYNTTAIANWDSTFGIYNGSSRVNIFSNFVKDGSWHYHVITFDGANVKYYCDGILKQTSSLTGTLPAITGFKIGLGRAGGVYRQIKQKMSDLRIYTTALSAEDVLDLYHTSANIDNEKRLHSFEFVEDDGNRVDEQGLVHSCLLSSDSDLIKLLYDKELHIEPDGSVWAHIYHHNRPDLGSFSSTNDFANSVKIDDNRWFNATEIVNSFSSEWEFLIIYNFTQGGTIYKERWIQTKNPETAVFGDVDAADITRVTGGEYKTGTWGGLYKNNGSAYWVMNNGTNGNWWGATGSFSIYQGGIPGYGGSITTTGCNDLYIRIDRFSSTPTQASIGRGSVYTFNDFIEK